MGLTQMVNAVIIERKAEEHSETSSPAATHQVSPLVTDQELLLCVYQHGNCQIQDWTQWRNSNRVL